MTNKNVIYTAIYGKYDFLRDPEFVEEDCDYICYTDQADLKSDIWDIRQRISISEDSNRAAKIFKILPHLLLREYEISVWVDANVRIKKSLLGLFLPYLKKNSLACLKHPDRVCIYEEARACKQIKKDKGVLIDKQMKKYETGGYPINNGLYACTVFARRHNEKKCIRLCSRWYEEIENYSRRDQLSLPYVLWRLDLEISVVDLYLWDNEYFVVEKHLGE